MFSQFRVTAFTLMTAALFTLSSGVAAASLKRGDTLPEFQLKTVSGQLLTNRNFNSRDLGVIFLFKTEKCAGCMDGLQQLQSAHKSLSDPKLLMVGIDVGESPELKKMASELAITFPVLAGAKDTIKQFTDSPLLPMTIFTGPDGQVLNVVPGGGGHVTKILTTLAEKQFQRKQLSAAKDLYAKAGDDPTAQMGLAYSLLKEGDLAKAEDSFKKLAASSDQEIALKGKEGLSEVYFQQGRTDEAMTAADEVLKADPNRSMARLVKGKALYAKGNKEQAGEELQKAADEGSASDFGWQKAEANMAFGNLKQEGKDTQIALKSYKEAVKNNPYYVEALSNQGVALQEMGDPEKAMEVFKNVQRIDPNDRLVHSLLRQAQEAIAQKKDLERQKYIDEMVTDLVARFKDQKKAPIRDDEWTSPVGAISILGFQNNAQGILMGRAGMEGVLQDELTRELGALNVSVVDRAILDKVLNELKLGSSELADPKTALKLGKITAAHVISTGSFYDSGQGGLATMRLVETETTNIFLAVSEKSEGAMDPSDVAKKFAQQIAAKVREKYPLKGRILKIKDNEVIINIGGRHAVTEGMKFNVLSEGEKLDLGDGEVEWDFNKLGEIQVTQVKEKVAYAKVVSKSGEWQKDQKIITQN